MRKSMRIRRNSSQLSDFKPAQLILSDWYESDDGKFACLDLHPLVAPFFGGSPYKARIEEAPFWKNTTLKKRKTYFSLERGITFSSLSSEITYILNLISFIIRFYPLKLQRLHHPSPEEWTNYLNSHPDEAIKIEKLLDTIGPGDTLFKKGNSNFRLIQWTWITNDPNAYFTGEDTVPEYRLRFVGLVFQTNINYLHVLTPEEIEIIRGR